MPDHPFNRPRLEDIDGDSEIWTPPQKAALRIPPEAVVSAEAPAGLFGRGSRKDDPAIRYDGGKPRFDLIPAIPMRDLADVFTRGAEKYAEHNWRKGMAWSRMLASMERHLNAWKAGEDRDPESGLYHLGQVAWGALCLLEYYRTHPELDDRYKIPQPMHPVP